MIIYNAEINGELKTVVTENGKIAAVEENRKNGEKSKTPAKGKCLNYL